MEICFLAPGGPVLACGACAQELPQDRFSRNMQRAGDGKRRCLACVERAEAQKAAKRAERPVDFMSLDRSAQGEKLAELQALCAETAREATAVTGIRAKGPGKGKGKGRK